MREIKFRGFCKDTNSWEYGSLVEEFDRNKLDENGKMTDYYQIYSKVSGWYVVEKKSVSQFTGIKDKKNVEIYEGDIMKDRFGATCEIVYVEKYASFKQLSKMGYSPLSQSAIISDNDIVIGNIYENPELL